MQEMQNSQTAFYVSHAGQTYGPWTVVEITKRIAQMELIATDYIYDEQKSGWVPLLECNAVVSALRAAKPSAPPGAPPRGDVEKRAAQPVGPGEAVLVSEPSASGEESGGDWFIQRESHRYGPFTYLGLIKALQEKSVFDFDLVWRNGMDEWIRIAEHEMFAPDVIRSLSEKKQADTKQFFFQRRFPRWPIQSEVIVHDNRSVWLGQTYEGSEGGSGMTIMNSVLLPGQVLFLHFTGFGELPAFNALCEIVNKRYVSNIRDPRTAVPYGVKFVKLEKHVQDAMREYYASKVA